MAVNIIEANKTTPKRKQSAKKWKSAALYSGGSRIITNKKPKRKQK
jgi:hypothetical protein